MLQLTADQCLNYLNNKISNILTNQDNSTNNGNRGNGYRSYINFCIIKSVMNIIKKEFIIL